MDIKELFQHISGHFKQDSQPFPDEVIQGFLRVLEEVRIEDMPCSQVYARLDQYVEREVHGEDAARIMPLLREHLDLCRDCYEEYEALLTILEKSSKR